MQAGKAQQASKPQQASKAFCKVCFDAGKPEKEYTSHYVKSQPGNEGKIVCPHLLSIECAYCKQKAGHTTRYCPVLLKKDQEKMMPRTRTSASSKKHATDEDGWSCVGSSQSSSSQSSSSQKSSPVTLATPVVVIAQPTGPTWASITATKAKVTVKPADAKLMRKAADLAGTPPPAPERTFQPIQDDDDDEDEEDDDEDIQYRHPAAIVKPNYALTTGCWADE